MKTLSSPCEYSSDQILDQTADLYEIQQGCDAIRCDHYAVIFNPVV
jgi:hypothetical protein